MGADASAVAMFTPSALIVFVVEACGSPTLTVTSYMPLVSPISHAAPACIWMSVSSRWSLCAFRSTALVACDTFQPKL